MKKKYGIVLIVVVALLIIANNSKQQVKTDVEGPIVGGFVHMGPVLHIYEGDNYIFSIFDNTHQIHIEFSGNGDSWNLSLSQPYIFSGVSLKVVPQSGRYKITCNGITQVFISNGKQQITIFYE